MEIIADTRETNAYQFDPCFAPLHLKGHYAEVTVTRAKLDTGDYSLPGLESAIAVERKASLTELVGNLSTNRERFERELRRATGLEYFYVIIEAPFHLLMAGQYRSKMNPHAAVQSVAAFMKRYRVPFIFAGNRMAAEYLTWSILHQFLLSRRKALAQTPQGSRIGSAGQTPQGISDADRELLKAITSGKTSLD